MGREKRLNVLLKSDNFLSKNRRNVLIILCNSTYSKLPDMRTNHDRKIVSFSFQYNLV
jgi:hypothetical protein